MEIIGPVVQVAIDVLTIDEALRVGEAALKAGATWLEAGTPLITFEGTRSIGALARAYPDVPVLADYKAMDGVAKYVVEAKRQGAQIATICSVASDASLRAMVQAGKEQDVLIISDLYAHPNPPARARELQVLGIDSAYVHLGADERREDPSRDPHRWLPAVVEAVQIPVGVGTFSVEDGVKAMNLGATVAVIGVPLITAADPEAELREYVLRAQDAWAARH